ncbi:MipA/OmpV family protein [Vibrio sp. Of7-15]|uniref:MipA/OmpV family protein n=1 Tax=Vibrio sp. Of7-15 TaxID=2724879 RepID=UPI001EF23E57|nr:MipA/OmpV family protein [Vibrio sp. Of7-15]MCG7495855.1 MipA/OmpV family protein [Vibrio sp. Of7-15]
MSLLVGAAVISSGAASAAISQWSVGAAASYSPVVYTETDSNKVVIPTLGYEGEHVFLRGFSAGARLYPIGTPQNVIFRLLYDPRTLKPEDSDNADIKLLDERKASILGAITYQVLTPVGVFEVGAGTDVGNKHNGLYAEAAWRLPIRMNGWGITPAIGYSYNSEEINNHLYGVSAAESARTSGRISAFEADWDGQYFVGLSGYFHITDRVRVTGGFRYMNLEGGIESSPIIEHTTISTGNIGISYLF